MKRSQGFDDLARQKLEERSFPFDEMHWEAMQRLLRSEGRRRRAARLRGAAALLLLLFGGGLVWFLSGNGRAPSNVSDDRVAAAEPARTELIPQGASDLHEKEVGTSASMLAGPSDLASPGSKTATHPTDGQANERTIPAAEGRTGVSAAPITGAATRDVNEGVPIPVLTVAVDPATDPFSATGNDAGADDQVVITSGQQPTMQPSAAVGAEQTPGTVIGSEAAILASEDPASSQAIAGSAADQPSSPPIQAAQDAISPVALASSTSDSNALAAPVVAAPVQPLDRSYLELSVLGGVMQAHNTYNGGSSDTWEGMISDLSSPAFGGELMHMRDHWGLGFGLHYSSYTEQLQIDEQYADRTELYYTHTFTPIDTTVMNVIDTVIIGGETYYVTEQFNTTIWVLDTQVDTNITSVLTREAVDRVNRVSYVEIPLLGDVHADRGRWRLGLRAGPTLGLLTTQQGAIPAGAGGSLVTFDDQPIRSTTLGYVARPYVRYLAGGSWSFGIEPCIRGQLLESSMGADLSRRSSALGMMGSVAFRLH